MDEDFLAGLTPEELAQLMGMGTLDEQGSLLERQMAQAQALRQPSGQHYSTGLGAAFGGAGDILRSIQGVMQENRLRPKQESLLKQKEEGRRLFADLLRRRGAPPHPPESLQPMDPNRPYSSFGF